MVVVFPVVVFVLDFLYIFVKYINFSTNSSTCMSGFDSRWHHTQIRQVVSDLVGFFLEKNWFKTTLRGFFQNLSWFIWNLNSAFLQISIETVLQIKKNFYLCTPKNIENHKGISINSFVVIFDFCRKHLCFCRKITTFVRRIT